VPQIEGIGAALAIVPAHAKPAFARRSAELLSHARQTKQIKRLHREVLSKLFVSCCGVTSLLSIA
jgi:hypothetical protein